MRSSRLRYASQNREAFGDGRECFGDKQVQRSRLVIKDRRQDEHHYRIRTRRQPNAEPQTLLDSDFFGSPNSSTGVSIAIVKRYPIGRNRQRSASGKLCVTVLGWSTDDARSNIEFMTKAS